MEHQLVDAALPESAAAATISGDETDWITTDPAQPYLTIELDSTSLDDLTIDSGKLTKDYIFQVVLQWGGTDDHELTGVTDGSIRVRRKLLPE